MLSIEPLNSEQIRAELLPTVLKQIPQLEILQTVTSTNTYLLNKLALPTGYICLAEQQTAGRGRHNKKWYSPASGNIYLSLNWQFSNAQQLTGLSLIIGIAIVEALTRYGITNIGLKWPNDILYKQQKLAGVLIEINRENNNYRAILGIGINVAMPKEHNPINQPWIDLATILQKTPARNLLISYLLNELFTLLPIFQTQGLSAFLKQWRQYDVLINKQVTLEQQQHPVAGTAMGIDEDGNLLVNIEGKTIPFYSGEVSVHLANK